MGNAGRSFVEENKYMYPIILAVFDAMRIRDMRFGDDVADAFTMMKEWCGLEDSEGQQVKEPRREPERMDAMARLAAGVAHEFNNILAVILLNAEMLGDRVGNDNKQVRAVIRATSRGAELTQQLLAFSRQHQLNLYCSELIGIEESWIRPSTREARRVERLEAAVVERDRVIGELTIANRILKKKRRPKSLDAPFRRLLRRMAAKVPGARLTRVLGHLGIPSSSWYRRAKPVGKRKRPGPRALSLLLSRPSRGRPRASPGGATNAAP